MGKSIGSRIREYVILTAMSIIVFMLMISGCGKKEPDPDSGVYRGVSAQMMGVSMSIDDLYEGGVSFELKDGGKGTCTLDGTDYRIKWTLDGNTFHAEGGGAEFDGTLSNGVMELEDLLGMGIDMTFICDELYDGTSDSGSPSDGGVLERLKDAKSGEDVYFEKQ